MVAAIVRNSPRANAGFNRFAASFWPAAAPAPTTVCASSMKRMIGRGLALTSSITDFSRFSNSPRTPAPACKSPRSSVRTITSRKAGGTSPSAMRSAKPSTTAVLPTPASPVRIGLFWRRRVRMSTTWRISLSRPRIGSILPARALAVRSIVNCESAPDAAPVGALAPFPTAGGPSVVVVAVAASLLAAVTAAKSRLSASAGIRNSWPEASRARRASASSATSAQMRCPERSRVSPCSTEASSHASLARSTISGDRLGARALPVRMRSSARPRSARSRPSSTS